MSVKQTSAHFLPEYHVGRNKKNPYILSISDQNMH